MKQKSWGKYLAQIFSLIKGQYLAQIKIQIVKWIGCLDAAYATYLRQILSQTFGCLDGHYLAQKYSKSLNKTSKISDYGRNDEAVSLLFTYSRSKAICIH